MRFSIIVPVYKTEKYLPQCVDSILAQDFKDFELVLVDNESPDACPEICENYAKVDNRVRVIHKPHGKAASARNVGMKAAQGEYLCFLDSDDFWVDGQVLSKINERLVKSSADILELYYQFYYQSTGRYLLPNETDFSGFDALANEEKIAFLIRHDRLNPSAWGMCIKRTFLESNNGYFDEDLVTEDIEWCIRLYSHAPKVDALSDAIYVYRKNREGSITSRMGLKNIDDLCGIVENAPQILNDRLNPIHLTMMNYVTYQSLIASASLYRKNTGLTKEERNKLRERLKSFSKGYLKAYSQHPKVKKALIVYRFFGYDVMARVLGFYLNHRGR